MNKEQKITAEEIESSAAEAELAAETALKEQDDRVYIHRFKCPFPYQGTTIETLTFDWSKLTGADHLAIENELLMRGKTLVTPEFTGEFLCGMAVRACTDRNSDGFRVLTTDVLKALPLRDFQSICKRARSFLLRAEL